MEQSHGHPNSAKNIALLLYVRALGIFCYSSIIESKLTTIADISEKLACNSKPPVVQTLVGGRQVEGKYIFWEDLRTMEDLTHPFSVKARSGKVPRDPLPSKTYEH